MPEAPALAATRVMPVRAEASRLVRSGTAASRVPPLVWMVFSGVAVAQSETVSAVTVHPERVKRRARCSHPPPYCAATARRSRLTRVLAVGPVWESPTTTPCSGERRNASRGHVLVATTRPGRAVEGARVAMLPGARTVPARGAGVRVSGAVGHAAFVVDQSGAGVGLLRAGTRSAAASTALSERMVGGALVTWAASALWGLPARPGLRSALRPGGGRGPCSAVWIGWGVAIAGTFRGEAMPGSGRCQLQVKLPATVARKACSSSVWAPALVRAPRTVRVSSMAPAKFSPQRGHSRSGRCRR